MASPPATCINTEALRAHTCTAGALKYSQIEHTNTHVYSLQQAGRNWAKVRRAAVHVPAAAVAGRGGEAEC